jgi:hypothetical protein
VGGGIIERIGPMAKKQPGENPNNIYKGKGDPGTYLTTDNPDDDLPWFGPGWYHVGTSGNDSFRGHDDVLDYYIMDFDFDLTRTTGADTTNVFERFIDQIVLIDSFTEPQQPAPDQNWTVDFIYAKEVFSDTFKLGFDITRRQEIYDPTLTEFLGAEDVATLGSLRATYFTDV